MRGRKMIKLIKGYPYDNSYDYIKLYKTKEEQNSFFTFVVL